MSERMDNPHASVARRSLTTPRSAAIAGVLFALLYGASLALIRHSIPADPTADAGVWLESNAGRISLALNLVPYAGIAFLWFIGVIRDRLGDLEDRFFATVFLGSGLMFLALTFVGAALAGGLLSSYADRIDCAGGKRRLHLWPRGDVSRHQRLCRSYGRRLHDLVRHHLVAHWLDASWLGARHLCTGASLAGHHRIFPVGDLDLPCLGTGSQPLFPDPSPARSVP